ncbi:MAG: nitrile hydratase accessory protein [Salinisphaeraceae bacterium]
MARRDHGELEVNETSSIDDSIAQMRGEAALPRANGELVFEDPWQGRVFGIAVQLHQEGRYDWAAFQQRLIDEIAASGDQDRSASDYYGHWLAALERLAIERGLVDAEELAQRVDDYRHGRRDEVF